jgi:DNA primase
MSKIDNIKAEYTPFIYFNDVLNGQLGKATKGGWHGWDGLCPFHNDRKAGSFSVNTQTGAFKCFSCGTSGGDIISFHQQVNRVSFMEAINQLWEALSCKK